MTHLKLHKHLQHHDIEPIRNSHKSKQYTTLSMQKLTAHEGGNGLTTWHNMMHPALHHSGMTEIKTLAIESNKFTAMQPHAAQNQQPDTVEGTCLRPLRSTDMLWDAEHLEAPWSQACCIPIVRGHMADGGLR